MRRSRGSQAVAGDQAATGFRQFMSLSITTIGVSLATFVGMLLGLQSVSHDIQQKATEVHVAAALAPKRPELALKAKQLEQSAEKTSPTPVQWAAAVLFLLSLVFAMFFWWRGQENTDPAISNLGKSLLGLIGGALSILLNVPRG